MPHETNESRLKTLRLLQYTAPPMMFIVALIVYFILDPSLNLIVASVLAIIGVMDFAVFKFLADRIEQDY